MAGCHSGSDLLEPEETVTNVNIKSLRSRQAVLVIWKIILRKIVRTDFGCGGGKGGGATIFVRETAHRSFMLRQVGMIWSSENVSSLRIWKYFMFQQSSRQVSQASQRTDGGLRLPRVTLSTHAGGNLTPLIQIR